MHEGSESLARSPLERGLVAIGLVFVLVALGWGVDVYIRRERQAVLDHWRGVLNGMADDRKAGILRWLDERRAAAAALALLSGGDASTHGGGTGGGHRSAQVDERHMGAFLSTADHPLHYEGIVLLDSRGAVLAEAKAGIPLPEPARRRAVAAARAAEPTRLDFVEIADGRPLLTFVAPVGGPGGRPGGVPPKLLVFLIDPECWLFPFLRHDPLNTATAETLINRRDGGFVTYLSPLRFNDAAPLAFRIPITAAHVAAFDAVREAETFGEYVDYRGVEVLAATRHVQGMGWGLVAKIDRREAFAPYYAKLRASGAAGLGLLLGLASLAYALWRRQRAAYLEELARRDERYRLLSDNTDDIVLFMDMEGRILEANAAAAKGYGRSRDVLRGMSVADLRTPEALGDWAGHRRAAAAEGSARFETVHRRADHGVFPVEVSASVVRVGEASLLLEVVRDVSERKAAEARITELNRLLRTISEVNQMMVQEADATRLLARTCGILVEHGGFRTAWVGLADETSGEVRPVAQAGATDGYPEEPHVRWDDSPRGRGPAGSAIRAGRPVICNDTESDERFEPWREAARRRGYRACAALPFRGTDRVDHVLVVYAAEPAAFAVDEVSLLGELADDVGFSLRALDEHAERERTEAALRLHAAVLEAAANAVVICDREGTILWTNPAFTALTGWAREEAVGQTPRLLRSGVHDHAFYQELWDTVLRGEAWRGEIVNRRKGGALYREEMTITPLRDSAGQISHLIAIKQDVHWRREAEDKLRESEARFGSLVQGLDAIVWEADAVTWRRPTFVSDQVERILGYSRERFLTEENFWLEHVHPDDRRLFESAFRRPLQPGRIEWEYRMRAADGRTVWFHDAAYVAAEASGAPMRVSGVMVDVTRHRELEHAVRAAAAEWTASVDSLELAVFVLDAHDRILRLNRAAASLMGAEADWKACLNRALDDLGDDEPWATIRAVVAQARGGAGADSYQARSPLGRTWGVDARRVAPSGEWDGRVIASLRDLTTLVEMQESVKRNETMAALGALVGAVAHQVRNPLFGMSVNIEALAALLEGREDVAELIAACCTERDRIIKLMEDLLHYGRPPSSERVPHRIEGVLAAAATAITPLAHQMGVVIARSGDAAGLNVLMDGSQIEDVVENALENACQHSPRGATITLEVRMHTDEYGRWARCVVRDRGPGLAPDVLRRVFEPFFTRRKGGIGLGLAIAQRIVLEHQGRISMANAEGGGAELTVDLPLCAEGAATRPS